MAEPIFIDNACFSVRDETHCGIIGYDEETGFHIFSTEASYYAWLEIGEKRVVALSNQDFIALYNQRLKRQSGGKTTASGQVYAKGLDRPEGPSERNRERNRSRGRHSNVPDPNLELEIGALTACVTAGFVCAETYPNVAIRLGCTLAGAMCAKLAQDKVDELNEREAQREREEQEREDRELRERNDAATEREIQEREVTEEAWDNNCRGC